MRPFQALGGVQGGEHQLVLLLAALHQADDDVDGLRHLQQIGLLALRALAATALGHPVDEVQHIGPAVGGRLLAVLARLQVGLVADVLQPLHAQAVRGLLAEGAGGALAQRVDVAAELVQRVQLAAGERVGQAFVRQGREQAQLAAACKGAQGRQRGVTDAALGRADGAQEGRVVVLIDEQAQPGAQVADLGAVEETLAPADLVGNLRAAQHLLELLGLVVGAVEDGAIAPPAVRAVLFLLQFQTLHGALGLVRLVVAGQHRDGLALAQLAPELLLEQLGVGGDDVVGGAQDGARAAVVLLERDDLERRVVGRQALEVLQRRAAPAVDALVVVAHRGEEALRTDQGLEQRVLHGIGVLHLVDQHMAEALLPARRHLGVAAQQLQWQADQVVEVHRLVGGESFAVLLEHQRRLAFVLALGHRQCAGRVQALVLPQRDLPLPELGQAHVGGRRAVADQVQCVVGVEDAELRLQPQLRPLLAQEAHAQRVEGGDHQLAGRLGAHQFLGALAHLLRGLVGEGDGGDLARRQAELQQAHDLGGDDARLSRAGACQHQAGRCNVVHRLLLGGVESLGHRPVRPVWGLAAVAVPAGPGPASGRRRTARPGAARPPGSRTGRPPGRPAAPPSGPGPAGGRAPGR